MNVEEAIQTAIEYETRVRDVYGEALRKAKDPVGKRVFQVLADEEQHHLEYLQHKLREWKETGTVTTEGLKCTIPTKKSIQTGVSKLERKMSGKNLGSEIEMLQKAFEVEAETSAFYKKMVDSLPEEGQGLFTRFMEIEEGHVALVQAELDYVTGTGFWFDFREFDLEAN